MYRVKQLFGGSLTLRDYDGQVAEAMALVRALNKMTKAGMQSVRMPENTTRYGGLTRNHLFNSP
jgi:O-acetyl-ADP-ribose deacetylase (regulator of RNase III)